MTGAGFELLSLPDIGLAGEIPEDFDTLKENALAKAHYIYKRTHIPVFADDTGLEVDVLNGRPGVFSARYAGTGKNDAANIHKLLRELQNEPNRNARFKTVIAFIPPDGKEIFFEGIINGTIGMTPKGDQGFGYDPVFLPEGYDISFAEMDPVLKNKISHRSRAFEKFITYLNKNFTV